MKFLMALGVTSTSLGKRSGSGKLGIENRVKNSEPRKTHKNSKMSFDEVKAMRSDHEVNGLTQEAAWLKHGKPRGMSFGGSVNILQYVTRNKS